MSIAVEGRGLVKRYESDGMTVDALRGVDVTIAAGEFVSVMGPSGSGKSTLLHLLGGLDVPTEGEVLIGDQRLSSLGRGALAAMRSERIGFVFQLYNLVPSLSVAENVALPAIVVGQRPSSYRARVDELLELVGLAGKGDRSPTALLSDCHKSGQTIVLVTHDVKVASAAQRLLHMRDGRIAEETRLDDADPSPVLARGGTVRR
jgi:putative ABC transport system ATP-binding protein